MAIYLVSKSPSITLFHALLDLMHISFYFFNWRMMLALGVAFASKFRWLPNPKGIYFLVTQSSGLFFRVKDNEWSLIFVGHAAIQVVCFSSLTTSAHNNPSSEDDVVF